MIIKHLFKRPDPTPLLTSRLYDEKTFYPAFLNDLRTCERELIIESPFITLKRMNALYPSFRRLTKRGVRVVINTRDPAQHEWRMATEAAEVVRRLQAMGVRVLYTDNLHRKLAVVDGNIFYEGSLNILSQNVSSELMRRIESQVLANEMIEFARLQKFMNKC